MWQGCIKCVADYGPLGECSSCCVATFLQRLEQQLKVNAKVTTCCSRHRSAVAGGPSLGFELGKKLQKFGGNVNSIQGLE